MNAAEAASRIANDYLGLGTLERQNRDSLDFKSFNVTELKVALVEAFKLGQRTPLLVKKWYCFDRHDSFGSFDTPAEASQHLEGLANEGMEGLHMALMTEEQFQQYCTDGRFPFAK